MTVFIHSCVMVLHVLNTCDVPWYVEANHIPTFHLGISLINQNNYPFITLPPVTNISNFVSSFKVQFVMPFKFQYTCFCIILWTILLVINLWGSLLVNHFVFRLKCSYFIIKQSEIICLFKFMTLLFQWMVNLVTTTLLYNIYVDSVLWPVCIHPIKMKRRQLSYSDRANII